jgi:glycosyltransferase involved in cell wall biosynthesis
MKILQISPYFLPHTGGVEKYVFNLSTCLVKQGHQVEVITSNIPAGLKNEERNGLTITRLNTYGEPLRNPIVPNILFSLNEVNDYDVINIHNIYAFSSVFASIKKRRKRIPLVLTHHGKLQFGTGIKDTIVYLYEQTIAKKIVSNVDCSVALTASDAQFLSTLGMDTDTIRLIPNGIDIAEFEQFNNLDPIRCQESLGLKEKFIILFVGEITYRKGIHYLIGAMSEIKNTISPEEIALLIIGSGPELKSIQTMVKRLDLEKYIFIKGRVANEELMQSYTAASLFVLPSLSEGMPTAILEALYFNIPVITTDIPNLRDSFKEMAILVPPKDEKRLTAAILDAFYEKESLDKQHLPYKKYVESHYSWQNLSKHYEKIYQNLGG